MFSEGRSSHHRGAGREKHFTIINRTDKTAAALGLESLPGSLLTAQGGNTVIEQIIVGLQSIRCTTENLIYPHTALTFKTVRASTPHPQRFALKEDKFHFLYKREQGPPL